MHTHTHTHTNADAKNNTSFLISKAQHQRTLETTQPMAVQFFSGAGNRKCPGIQSDSASSCFQGHAAAPRLHRWRLSGSSAVSCSPSSSCKTPGAKERAGKIASRPAHLGNYQHRQREREKKTCLWREREAERRCIKTQTSHHLCGFFPAHRWDLISLRCFSRSRSYFLLKLL